jgi:Domain of unknown function (DUF4282)
MNSLKDIASFRTMVTPAVVQFLFWVGSGLCMASWLLANVMSFLFVWRLWAMDWIGWFTALMMFATFFVMDLFGLLFAMLVVRLTCEGILVHFKTCEHVEDIRVKVSKGCRRSNGVL